MCKWNDEYINKQLILWESDNKEPYKPKDPGNPPAPPGPIDINCCTNIQKINNTDIAKNARIIQNCTQNNTALILEKSQPTEMPITITIPSETPTPTTQDSNATILENSQPTEMPITITIPSETPTPTSSSLPLIPSTNPSNTPLPTSPPNTSSYKYILIVIIILLLLSIVGGIIIFT